jgi:hypothetical protein
MAFCALVDRSRADEPLPLPRHETLDLLVGRITTIKLGYWAAVTLGELALPRVIDKSFTERFPFSITFAAIASLLALAWARWQARAVDRRAGGIERGIATIATTFVAASVVASPAMIPLLLIERERSLEGCPASITCHIEAIWLWVALLVIGVVFIPAVFAASLRGARRPLA